MKQHLATTEGVRQYPVMKSWVEQSILYQINLRSLAAREPRNAFEAALEEAPPSESPLRYVAARLAGLKPLGVNVLHIMPPFPMGQEGRKGIGSPYAARDYQAVDGEYGTLDDFRTLVRNAHDEGFKVIIGMVPNHTSRDHVWVTPHPEYYVHNDAGEIIYDLDWSDTAKLDYTHPDLRRAMIAVYDFWLNLLDNDGVDGFRIDMAHFINDRTFWNECMTELKARHAGRELLFLAECYGIDNSVDLFDRGFNASYDDAFYKIQERFYGRDANGASCFLPEPGMEHDAGCRDMYDAWLQGGVPRVANNLLEHYESLIQARPTPAFFARYSDNHDEGRGVYRFGDGAVRAFNIMAALSHYALPFILTGQEFGAANRPSIHERVGPCDKGFRTKRDGTIIRREGVEFEGNIFARGVGARRAWYAFYRELFTLRNNHPALVHGAWRPLDVAEDGPATEKSIVAFERTFEGTVIRCAVNVGPMTRPLDTSSLFNGEVWYGRCPEGRLAPFSGLAVRVE
ncbi:MAG: DUF3459 domain-containing protein [Spartobacteria bacterium]|nr:DUF3459 domain-containing protein [Spartobacteria bacterium]